MKQFSQTAASRVASAFLTLFLLLFLPACVPTKPTRVILVGGAGVSQLGDLGMTISAMCPETDVVETSGWDGFRGDVVRAATEPPCQSVILIGHSFGCQTIADAAANLERVDLVVLIDPAWEDIMLPRSVMSAIWYARSQDVGMERRALVHNAGRPIVISGDHNKICHDDRLKADVGRLVRNINDRNALRQRLKKTFR